MSWRNRGQSISKVNASIPHARWQCMCQHTNTPLAQLYNSLNVFNLNIKPFPFFIVMSSYIIITTTVFCPLAPDVINAKFCNACKSLWPKSWYDLLLCRTGWTVKICTLLVYKSYIYAPSDIIYAAQIQTRMTCKSASITQRHYMFRQEWPEIQMPEFHRASKTLSL